MLEFALPSEVFAAYKRGDIKDGDHFIDKPPFMREGVETVLIDVNLHNRMINTRPLGVPKRNGSKEGEQAKRNVHEILARETARRMYETAVMGD